jgi:uncharacterized membrane protein YgdD (TMEM256/DUF423 family)
MAQLFGLAGALYGAVGVVLGAFGAHALRNSFTPRALETWQTAVNYQLLHALALLAVYLLMRQAMSAGVEIGLSLKIAGWAFVAGVLMFSGSLYALAFGAPGIFGPITPLGGVSFIVGWLSLAVAIVTFNDA